jgi:hypothetical protein
VSVCESTSQPSSIYMDDLARPEAVCTSVEMGQDQVECPDPAVSFECRHCSVMKTLQSPIDLLNEAQHAARVIMLTPRGSAARAPPLEFARSTPRPGSTENSWRAGVRTRILSL